MSNASFLRSLSDREIDKLLSLSLTSNSNLRHELVSPLNVLMQSAELLDIDSMRSEGRALLTQALHVLRYRLSSITIANDIRGGFTFSPAKTISQIVSLFKQETDIRYDPTEVEDASFLYPENALISLLFELIDNAIKHRDSVEEPASLVIEYRRDGKSVRVSLHDTCPILSEELDNVFRPLQIPTRSKRRPANELTRFDLGVDGQGQGIDHVKKILFMSEGSIDARRSAKLRGNEIRVSFEVLGIVRDDEIVREVL